MKSTLIPALVITLVASVIGLGFNALRSDVRIDVKRNYFRVASTQSPDTVEVDAPMDPTPKSAGSAEPGSTGLQHPFVMVTVDEVIGMIESEAYFLGEIVLIDARNAGDYEQGHIPRSLHLDNYNVDNYIADVKPCLDAADTIVVYCGGGDCEDSIFLATELEFRGISRSRLRLFEGGMADWRNRDQPVDEGREQCHQASP